VLFPSTVKAIKLLNKYNFKVIVLTNQSGVARGYFSEETLAEIHEKMKRELSVEGAWVDDIYYCPHHPDDNCECRKPKTGLVTQAVKKHGIDLSQSYLIGDLNTDISLGKAVDCKTILIADQASKDIEAMKPDAVTTDLLEAVRIIMDKFEIENN